MNSEISLPPKKLKRSKWTLDEERHLLQIWAIYEVELPKTKRNSHIYAKMASEMGGKLTAQEVHTKITNMAHKYRSEKKDIGPSGGSPSIWPHFQEVHKIIGGNAVNNNTIVESFLFDTNSSTCSQSILQSPPPLSSSPPLSSPPSVSALSPPTLSSSPPPPTFPSPLPSTSASSARKKRSNYNAEILENIKQLTVQGKEHTEVFKSVAANTQHLCQIFSEYLVQRQENERVFMECFTKLVEKD